MHARRLPGSWSSTANALEGYAFTLKDTLFVIDDFLAKGSKYDIAKIHREADRILRAQGNRSGRQRMRADATLRPTKPPRCLILSTGEDIPRGQSLRARILVVEVSKGNLNWELLSQCQVDAQEGIYAQVMSSYIAWIANNHPEISKELRDCAECLREEMSRSGMHRRTMHITINLILGWAFFLMFAMETQSLTSERAETLFRECQDTLEELMKRQEDYHAASEPAQRFITLLRAALTSGKAHVGDLVGETPTDGNLWGWQGDIPQGPRVGWIDDGNLYLEPEASYATIQRMGDETGEPLGVSSQTLRKHLYEAKLLKSTDRRDLAP